MTVVCDAQYQQSNVFDTRGQYRLSCEHLAYLFPARLGTHPTLQVTAEASTLSFIFVTVIFIWIGVRPTSFHVFVMVDEDVAQRNVYWYRKEFPNNSNWKLFQKPSDIFMVCLTVYLLTFARLIELYDRPRFLCSTLCKQLVVSLISGGLTTGSSPQGPIAQHKALSNRLVTSESP